MKGFFKEGTCFCNLLEIFPRVPEKQPPRYSPGKHAGPGGQWPLSKSKQASPHPLSMCKQHLIIKLKKHTNEIKTFSKWAATPRPDFVGPDSVNLYLRFNWGSRQNSCWKSIGWPQDGRTQSGRGTGTQQPLKFFFLGIHSSPGVLSENTLWSVSASSHSPTLSHHTLNSHWQLPTSSSCFTSKARILNKTPETQSPKHLQSSSPL